MILVTWENANESEYPVIAYRCFDSSLPIFKYRKNPKIHKQSDGMMLLDNIEIDTPQDDNEAESGERRYYRMRLPYTKSALANRLESGGDIPEWLHNQVDNKA